MLAIAVVVPVLDTAYFRRGVAETVEEDPDGRSEGDGVPTHFLQGTQHTVGADERSILVRPLLVERELGPVVGFADQLLRRLEERQGLVYFEMPYDRLIHCLFL